MLKRNAFILLAACSLVATPLFAEDMPSGSQMNNMGMKALISSQPNCKTK